MTKEKFIAAYRTELLVRYGWAQDDERVERFLASVRETLFTSLNTWNNDGDAVKAAWRQIGGKGAATYKALRGLT